MPELRCPECNDPIDRHDDNGCYVGWGNPAERCQCKLTEAQALRAAQRKEAAWHLAELHESWVIYRRGWLVLVADKVYDKEIMSLMDSSKLELKAAIAAYRAVGILGQRKGGE